MILHPCQPYDLNPLFRALARFPYPALFALTENSLLRVLHSPEGAALVQARMQGQALAIQSLHGDISPELLQHAFGTDCDLGAFYEFSREHPALWQVVEPLVGLPVWREETLYQTLIFVIIEQHISWKNARLAQLRLLEWGGNRFDVDGHILYALPTPEQLAHASIDDLVPLKITFRRMQMLIDLARSIADGSLDLEAWMQLEPAALYEQLCTLHGVGHWTAAVVVARAKGIFSYIPQNDVALQAAVAHYFHAGKSAAEVLRVLGEFGEYGGLAAHFTLMRWVLDRYPLQTDLLF